MQVNQIRIEKLERPEHHGDWHDAPLRWVVIGPGTELQKFSNKKEAAQYATIRRRHLTQATAINVFVARSLGYR